MLEEDVYLWLHRCLETDSELSEARIVEEFGSDSDEEAFALEYLDRLTRNDILRESDGVYSVADPDAERSAYYRLLGTDSSEYDRPDDLSYQPVLSVPTKIQEDWEAYAREEGVSPGVGIRSALETVIEDADESLRISAPFFEIDGLNLLDDAFTEVAQRDISIKLLVREVLTSEPRSYSQNRRRKAIAEVIDRFESVASAESSIAIRDYHHEIGGEYSKLDRSVHAKLILADNSTAYVGSGEIRDSSMNLNAEGGYLIGESEDIAQWRAFFDFLWERSSPVRREEFDE